MRTREALDLLGIRTVIDLRSSGERAKTGASEALLAGDGRNRRVVHVPLLDEGQVVKNVVQRLALTAPQILALGLCCGCCLGRRGVKRLLQVNGLNALGLYGLYVSILRDSRGLVRQALEEILSALAEDNGAVLVHCTAGKDRTGLLCMLLYCVAGADDEAVAQDYAQTERSLGMITEEAIAQFGQGPDGGPADIDRELLRARATTMAAVLSYLRQEYGSVSNYLTDHVGFSWARQVQLRLRLQGRLCGAGQG